MRCLWATTTEISPRFRMAWRLPGPLTSLLINQLSMYIIPYNIQVYRCIYTHTGYTRVLPKIRYIHIPNRGSRKKEFSGNKQLSKAGPRVNRTIDAYPKRLHDGIKITEGR